VQPSRYLKAFHSGDGRPEKYLLFSQKKASILRLNQERYRAFMSGTLSPSDEATLVRLGMLVEDPETEKLEMLGFFDRLNARNHGLNITVVLNLDCNFSCTYCYEDGLKGSLYMSPRTADLLLDFIRTKFTSEKRDLVIDFYGGEPLLSPGLIKYISEAASAFTRARGARYRFTLVTNGSLFRRRLAEELTALGLESVKITLDGPAEIHNQSRPYKSGAGSFDHIIRNIQETCDLVKIGLGGNFQRDNYHGFVSLLDYLKKVGLTPDKIAGIKFDPAIRQPAGNFSPVEYRGGCVSINEPWLFEAVAFLREEILKRGYVTQKAQPVTCMVEVTDSYVVNFDGVIYKCPAFTGRKGYKAGDLENGLKEEYAALYKLGYWKNQACADCNYLPLCFGGCRYMSFLRDGHIGAVDCRKAYMDACLEILVKQEVKYSPRRHNAKPVKMSDREHVSPQGLNA
jgi:uncharacterized protein